VRSPVLCHVEAVLDGELADVCFTDPPYNVKYANGSNKKRSGKKRPILNDALGADFGELLYDASVNILTVTKGGVYSACRRRNLTRCRRHSERPAVTGRRL
jgi:DNA modification methylase